MEPQGDQASFELRHWDGTDEDEDFDEDDEEDEDEE